MSSSSAFVAVAAPGWVLPRLLHVPDWLSSSCCHMSWALFGRACRDGITAQGHSSTRGSQQQSIGHCRRFYMQLNCLCMYTLHAHSATQAMALFCCNTGPGCAAPLSQTAASSPGIPQVR